MESSPKHKNKKQRTESTTLPIIPIKGKLISSDGKITGMRDLIKELDDLNLPPIDVNKLIQFTGGDKVKASSLMQNK